MADQYIIAVDPGTVDCGLFILKNGEPVHHAKLHVPHSRHLYQRIALLVSLLGKVWAASTKMSDDVHLVFESPIYMEGNFSGSGGGDLVTQARPIKELYMFVGALVYWGETRCNRVVGYDVGEVKEGIGGSKRASKKTVAETLRLDPDFGGKLDGQDMSSHEWDALSVGVYHLAQLRIAAATIEGDPRR